MSKTYYNKLVRDRIPEIIQATNRACETKTLDLSDYQQALRNKVIEESKEVANASNEELAQEIADLYEVLDALLVAYKISQQAIIRIQKDRRDECGGFEKRICLLWSE